jgi:curved DNA-binding protein CbpA
MRLFHPDRQTARDERTDAFATRINQAYTVLRSPGAKADYDFSLRQKQAVQPKPRPYPTHRAPPRSPGVTGLLPPFVVRHLAPFMLAGIATLVTLGVLLVYVNQPPKGAIGSGASGFSQAPGADSPPPARQPDPVPLARADMDALARQPAREPLPSPDEPLPPAETAPRPAPPSPARGAHPMADQMGSTATRPARAVTVAVREAPVKTAQEATNRLPAAIGMPAAVDPPKVPEFKPRLPRPEQLNSLLARFADLYQRGDLEGLLELFDGSARIERGDRTQIRAEYGELFRNSEGRSLHVWDVAWSAHGEVTRGEGQFQARVMQKGERSPRVYNGTLTIEAIQRNERPLIVGLYQKAEH